MFHTLKSVVAATVIAAMALAASCSYDDSAINERVDRVEKDLAALTERVDALEKKLGEEVDALKKLIEKQTVVTKVEKADDGSTKVTLSDGSSFTVYPKAEAAAEAVDTTIAPNKDADGTYYWAIFDGGKFQKYLEVDGQKVPVFAAESEAEGCVCELKFSVDEKSGKLLVSIDGGKTWVDSGLAAQQVATTGVFSEVKVNDNNTVTLVLADGEELTVALAELIECEATRTGVYVLPGEVKAVRFTVNDAVEDINVMNQPHGWAASVEVAPVEEENGDENVDGPVAEPLAAGGTDYVLNIAGPAVGDKYAAKEGVVSVHFNTASGACKVLSVKVNLAELTLSIDKDGNLTITSSVAMLQKGHQGSYVDFADFCFGFTSASEYQYYLDGEEPYVYEWFVTHRFYLGQLLENGLIPYEEGVYEKETITVSCDDVIKGLRYGNEAKYGEEYVFFASLGETMVQGQSFPDLANAAVATYTKTLVDAEVVDTAWNDATVKLSLLGYNSYIVGWVSTETVEQTMENFGLKTLDEFYDKYLRNQMSGSGFDMSIGAVMFPTMMDYTIEDTEIALSEMAQYSMTGWAPSVEPGTEYRLFVFPFNIVDFNDLEMAIYTGEFDYSNVVDFGTFSTDALVEGEFVAAATFGEPYFEDNGVEVSVTITGEDVAVVEYVAYQFFDEPKTFASDRVEKMFGENFFYTELVELDDTKAFSASHYNVSNPCYLSMVLINAEGEYVFVEQEFVNYTEFTYSQADFADGVLTLKGEGATDLLKITVNPGLESLVAGDYVTAAEDWTSGTCQVQWSSADAKEIFANATHFNYEGSASSYGYWASANFKMSVAVEGDVYTIVATDNISGVGPVKFLFTGAFGIEESSSNKLVSAVATYQPNDTNWYALTLTDADGNEITTTVGNGGVNYMNAGTWSASYYYSSGYGLGNTYYNTTYSTLAQIDVKHVDDQYELVVTVDQGVFTYKGAIEGFIVPEPFVLPNCENLTFQLCKADGFISNSGSGYGDIRLVDAEGKNYINIEVNDNPLYTYSYVFDGYEGYDAGKIYAPATYVRYDGPGYDGDGMTPAVVSGTLDIVKDGDNSTITINFVLEDNNKFSGVYTGALPF